MTRDRIVDYRVERSIRRCPLTRFVANGVDVLEQIVMIRTASLRGRVIRYYLNTELVDSTGDSWTDWRIADYPGDAGEQCLYDAKVLGRAAGLAVRINGQGAKLLFHPDHPDDPDEGDGG